MPQTSIQFKEAITGWWRPFAQDANSVLLFAESGRGYILRYRGDLQDSSVEATGLSLHLSEIEGLETSADAARLLAIVSASDGSADTAMVYDTLSGAPLLERRLDDAVGCLSVDGEYLIVIDEECTQLLAIAETGTSIQTRLLHEHHDLPLDHFAYSSLDTPTEVCAVPLGNVPGRFALAVGCYGYLLVHHLSVKQETSKVTLASDAYQIHTGWAYDPVWVGPRIPGGFLLAGGHTIINVHSGQHMPRAGGFPTPPWQSAVGPCAGMLSLAGRDKTVILDVLHHRVAQIQRPLSPVLVDEGWIIHLPLEDPTSLVSEPLHWERPR